MAIEYQNTLSGIDADQLDGFFVGWPNPPLPEAHIQMLEASDAFELAVEVGSGRVVGFVTALTDNRFAMHVTFLEVLPGYQHRGVGSTLMRRLLGRYEHVYGVSVQCDEAVRPFYANLGMRPVPGMGLWRYDRQSGG